MEKLFLKLTNQDLALFNEETGTWQDAIYEEEYEFYMSVAIILIENYLKIDECEYVDIRQTYKSQTTMLASYVYGVHKVTIASDTNTGIKSISSNGRSVVFMDSTEVASMYGIPTYIKDMLPKVKSRVKVW